LGRMARDEDDAEEDTLELMIDESEVWSSDKKPKKRLWLW